MQTLVNPVLNSIIENCAKHKLEIKVTYGYGIKGLEFHVNLGTQWSTIKQIDNEIVNFSYTAFDMINAITGFDAIVKVAFDLYKDALEKEPPLKIDPTWSEVFVKFGLMKKTVETKVTYS